LGCVSLSVRVFCVTYIGLLTHYEPHKWVCDLVFLLRVAEGMLIRKGTDRAVFVVSVRRDFANSRGRPENKITSLGSFN